MRGGRLRPAASLLALSAAVGAWAHLVGALPGERAIEPWFRGEPNPPGADNVAAFLDALGSPPVVAATVAFGGWALARRLGPRYAVLLVAAASVVLFSTAVKAIIGPTPLWTEWMAPAGEVDANLPSGHSAYAAACFGLVVALARRAGWLEVAVAAGMLIGAMGPAAVLGRDHLPSDVLSGYALGFAWLLALLAVGLPWAARGRG